MKLLLKIKEYLNNSIKLLRNSHIEYNILDMIINKIGKFFYVENLKNLLKTVFNL